MTVAVVKLGVGNTASVMFALERLGARAVLTDDAERIADSKRLILPGVGAAAHAMRLMDAKGLRHPLSAFTRPLLGVCLGQQLLFESSAEGEVKGLGLISGGATRLPASPRAPLPHMGWSKLSLTRSHPLLEGVSEGDYVFFVHSYACPIAEETLASAEYGARFAAIVARGNVLGCQFHPERSGAVGARLLKNFLALPC